MSSGSIKESIREVESLERAAISTYKARRPKAQKRDDGEDGVTFKGLNERRSRQLRTRRESTEMPPKKRAKESESGNDETEHSFVEKEIDRVESTVQSAIVDDSAEERRGRRGRRTGAMTEFEKKEQSRNKKFFGIICGTLAAFKKEEEERKKSAPMMVEEEEKEKEGDNDEIEKENSEEEEEEEEEEVEKETEEEREKRLKEEAEKEEKAIKARWKLNKKLAERFNSTKTTPKIYWATTELLSKLEK